uniref:Uncharacterized protein n=1 Tax=Vespula pensylvanica TaxID=30213 RepID=A0A834U866_VESPE|nr:hypothetical protein H0235_009354 [Vespula pensylvanica]
MEIHEGSGNGDGESSRKRRKEIALLQEGTVRFDHFPNEIRFAGTEAVPILAVVWNRKRRTRHTGLSREKGKDRGYDDYGGNGKRGNGVGVGVSVGRSSGERGNGEEHDDDDDDDDDDDEDEDGVRWRPRWLCLSRFATCKDVFVGVHKHVYVHSTEETTTTTTTTKTTEKKTGAPGRWHNRTGLLQDAATVVAEINALPSK